MQALVGGGHEKYLTESWSLVRPRGSKALSPLLCLWNVHSARCSHSGSRFQGQRLERVICCWDHVDVARDWALLRPLYKSFFFKILANGCGLSRWFSGKEWIRGSGRSSREWNGNSSVLAWKTPWTEEPDRLWSIVLQRADTTEWLSVHTQVGAEIDLSHSQPRQASSCVSSLAC